MNQRLSISTSRHVGEQVILGCPSCPVHVPGLQFVFLCE